MASGSELSLLPPPKTKENQPALFEQLPGLAGGDELNRAVVHKELTWQFRYKARKVATVVPPTQPERIALPAPIELTAEVLAACLAGLERDYKRGIVVVDETKEMHYFKVALEKDRTAGTPWKTIQGKLEADSDRLLKEAAKLQGKGTLIGVYPDGSLCIKDRGNEPVIHATLGGHNIEITTDTPNRAELMKRVKQKGQFANYREIRAAVHGKGLELPPDCPDYRKKGVVAAAEAVTGEDFVRSANGEECISAVLECGDVSESSYVRIVSFIPVSERTIVEDGYPEGRNDSCGAVRVLRGLN